MKKGILMERHQDYMVMMRRDGLFQKALPVENVTIGSEIHYHPLSPQKQMTAGRLKSFLRRSASAFALVCLIILVILPVYFAYSSSQTYAYVTIDINPSIKMELNKKTEMLSIRPGNDDATALIAELGDLKGRDIGVVLRELLQKSEAAGFAENGKNMIFGINYVDADNESNLQFEEIAELGWEIIELHIPEDMRLLAEEQDVSMNKILIEQAQSNPDIFKSLDPSEKEMIQLFYKEKFQGSSKTNDNERLKYEDNYSKRLKENQENHQEEGKGNRPSHKQTEKKPYHRENDSGSKKQPKPSDNEKKENKPKQPIGEQESSNNTHKPPHSKQKQDKSPQPPMQKKKGKPEHPPGQQKKSHQSSEQEKVKGKPDRPPGLEKNKEKPNHPPGQQKKQHHSHYPPGQGKKPDKSHLPPGLQKKYEGQHGPSQRKHN